MWARIMNGVVCCEFEYVPTETSQASIKPGRRKGNVNRRRREEEGRRRKKEDRKSESCNSKTEKRVFVT